MKNTTQRTGAPSSAAAEPRHLPPRGKAQIRVVELVHTKDGVIPVEELTAEQKRSLDRWIVKTWVNTLYQGRAEVYYPGAEKTDCHTSLRAGSQ